MKHLLHLLLPLVTACGSFSLAIVDQVDSASTVANGSSVNNTLEQVNNESTASPRNINFLPPYSVIVTMTPSVSPTRSPSSPSWSNENAHQSHEPPSGEKTYNNGRVNNANNNLPSLLPSLQQQAYELYLERLKRKKILYPYGVMRWDSRPVTNYFPLQSTPNNNLQPVQLHPSPVAGGDAVSYFSSNGVTRTVSDSTTSTTPQATTSARVTGENVTRDPLDIQYETQLHSRFQQLCIQIRGYRCDTAHQQRTLS